MESTAALLTKVYQAYLHIDLPLCIGSTAWWIAPLSQASHPIHAGGRCTDGPAAAARGVAWHASLAFSQGCCYRLRIELRLASQGRASARIMELGTPDAILGCVAVGMGFILMNTQKSRFGLQCLRLPEPLRHPIGVVDCS